MRFTVSICIFTSAITVTGAAPPNAGHSSTALGNLRQALSANPSTLIDLTNQPFATVPLTKADAAEVRALLIKYHTEFIRKNRSAEINNRVLTDNTLTMPFYFKTFGDKPAGGRSLWISLHGGGNTSPRTNDRQYENQKKLYSPAEGVYLAPRAPTNTWNLWHEPHIDRFFARLIEDMIVFEDVNPDRVYVLGYSAGGDGVYQIGPRMADAWAAAAMMAGHPNGVSMLSLRNCPFVIQVGGNDSAYNRNRIGFEYGQQLDKLQKEDPFGYVHSVKIHDGKPHWMGGEDQVALPWMAKFTRDPIPERIVWKQSSQPRTRFYWLGIPSTEAKKDSLLVVERKGSTFDVKSAELIKSVQIRLDDRMTNLDDPVTVRHAGAEIFKGSVSRTVGAMIRTLTDRGDPKLVFDAEVTVQIPNTEKP